MTAETDNQNQQLSDVGAGQAIVSLDFAEAISHPDKVTEEVEPRSWFLRTATVLSSSVALSWYLSVAIHLAGYTVGSVLFYMLGMHLQFFTDDTPLRATLGDEEVVDDSARLVVMQSMPRTEVEYQSAIERAANSLRAIENGLIDTNSIDLMSSAESSGSPEVMDEDLAGLLRVPEGGLAVTKGSFTAWTEPTNPTPFTPYKIIIEYRLPEDVKKIYLSDLKGTIRGTDGHEQNIPYDERVGAAVYANGERVRSNSQVIKLVNQKLQLVVTVPGAEKELVTDTIRIQSRRLKESQKLELVFQEFGQKDKDSGDSR
ncbi:MAG: hypothetical protein KDA96_09215 [Planctomycetaceae bacterium]|nr:hypothetical protein [Planctomycetaceae bacterium]